MTARLRGIGLGLVVAICVVSAGACSSTPQSVSVSSMPPAGVASEPSAAGPGARPPGPPPSPAQSEVMGVWQGTSLASCGNFMTSFNRCNAQQKISFTLVQDKSGLGGYYTCAYGTQNCLSMNTSGKIVRVDQIGSRLTMLVQMPNGTSCRYTGMRQQSDISGGYSCTAGSAALETGSWRAHHEY